MVLKENRHFGREIIANHLQLALDDTKVDTLWLKLYRVRGPALCPPDHSHPVAQEFIEGIDGIDNGVQQYPADIQPRYRNRTDLSSRVGWLNPAWNEPVDATSVDVSTLCTLSLNTL